ncbi:MAG: sigma-54-dependent Fis family transcriptional regulator, partial [Moraxellaceae bacterium]
VNCGAIPGELMESEFFGHKKGSFTGATEDKVGLFQSAQGGTLFLDEVADLPLSMQVKLLRAIQEKKIRPIGTQQEISVDIRLLSATHKNLQNLVQQGLFRQDLYYRIHVIEVNMPPLRERGTDILLLAQRFIEKICQEWGMVQPTMSSAAQQALMHYSFPGNVRELHNILERALTLSDGQEILPESLQLPQISQQFTNIIEMMKLRKNIQKLSYLLILHDITSPSPYKKWSKELAALNEADRNKAIACFRNHYANNTELNPYEHSENYDARILKSMKYDELSLLSSLSIYRKNYSDYIQVEFTSENPDLSAYAANTLCQEFIKGYESIISNNKEKKNDYLAELLLARGVFEHIRAEVR